ncbi:similar to Saccharomyces cerevisiae YHL008C Putative protein of unknown function, may be involved in the uptake of chloride ions [Maudiozyma saulgeensis]|uniref:YHL008C-like protein n=1 Tax=Maudiozyma saulgeensis TaxID=1789683 RepID=A0A1X7R853_9SACH|nr:similar to Saccharomyces cerevisiae YHL008C Putative protein of unknown function, may be involved in the uptake of chloride ions [Kazachstania saulgeensis]
MVDDSNYITPHEAALAVVATCMKKARLQLDTLIINSILGGLLFSSGSVLYVAVHAENLDILNKNPGLLNFLGGLTYSVGLFYVVMLGAELYNSDILFFTVGVLRGAASIYDLLISWLFSWLGNIAGSLFVSYLFIFVSGISEHEDWSQGAKLITESKADYSFMQTFLKSIAGNFFVCLAIYLQLMAKPIHVKFLMMLLPVFTFVSSSYTHVVADMTTFFIGMLCGANVSVGRYIWRVLIPASLGTIVGGASFGLVIPFYLHLVVVERDRAKLSLPEYEARDEQPELNMDSRVVRMPVKTHDTTILVTDSGSDSDDMDIMDEKESLFGAHRHNHHRKTSTQEQFPGRLPLSASPSASASISILGSDVSTNSSDMSLRTTNSETNSIAPRRYAPSVTSRTSSRRIAGRTMAPSLERINTLKSITSHRSSVSNKNHSVRSPPGVFPVAGMAPPLAKERTIENSNYPMDLLQQIKTHSVASTSNNNNNSGFNMQDDDSELLRRVKTAEIEEENAYLDDIDNKYSVPNDKLGSKLEKVVTRLRNGHKSATNDETIGTLPRTVQDTFPHNNVSQPNIYDGDDGIIRKQQSRGRQRKRRSQTSSSRRPTRNLFKTLSSQMTRSGTNEHDINDWYKKMSQAGVTSRAALGAQNVAGGPYLNSDDISLLRKINIEKEDENKTKHSKEDSDNDTLH